MASFSRLGSEIRNYCITVFAVEIGGNWWNFVRWCFEFIQQKKVLGIYRVILREIGGGLECKSNKVEIGVIRYFIEDSGRD